MSAIYKILKRRDWIAAQETGLFLGSEVDRRDGYIHFSTASQAQETATLHFHGQAELVVLEVLTQKLEFLVWEPSRGGVLFPHLYGPLAIEHVAAVYDAPLDPDGVPTLSFLNT